MIGFGLRNSFFNSANWRFRRAGYIIRNKHSPMGMEIPLNCKLLMAKLKLGKNCERDRPIKMQQATHMARYFSKMLRCDLSVIFPTLHS
jgi:hypothetical protein